MKKATILFGSTTGNTEIVADKIAENMPDYTVQASMSPTQGRRRRAGSRPGDLRLLHHGAGRAAGGFLPYYKDRMTPALLKGKNVAVFGLGDKENYEDTSAGRQTCWPRR